MLNDHIIIIAIIIFKTIIKNDSKNVPPKILDISKTFFGNSFSDILKMSKIGK